MPSPDTQYTLHGRVLEGDTPIDGARVVAFDADPGRPPTRLADTTTDADGRFEITFKQRQAGGRGEGHPEPFVEVSPAGASAPALRTDPISGSDTILDLGDLVLEATGTSVPDDSGMGGTGPLHDVQRVHAPSVHGRTPRGLLSVPDRRPTEAASDASSAVSCPSTSSTTSGSSSSLTQCSSLT